AEDLGADGAPGLGRLVVKAVRGLQKPGARARLGDERAAALLAAQTALALQLDQGLPHGGPRDAEVPAELRLGRDPHAGQPAARLELLGDQRLELEEERDGRAPVDLAGVVGQGRHRTRGDFRLQRNPPVQTYCCPDSLTTNSALCE